MRVLLVMLASAVLAGVSIGRSEAKDHQPTGARESKRSVAPAVPPMTAHIGLTVQNDPNRTFDSRPDAAVPTACVYSTETPWEGKLVRGNRCKEASASECSSLKGKRYHYFPDCRAWPARMYLGEVTGACVRVIPRKEGKGAIVMWCMDEVEILEPPPLRFTAGAKRPTYMMTRHPAVGVTANSCLRGGVYRSWTTESPLGFFPNMNCRDKRIQPGAVVDPALIKDPGFKRIQRERHSADRIARDNLERLINGKTLIP